MSYVARPPVSLPLAVDRSETGRVLPALPALADRCVQCGLCLPACPTYRSDRVEAESPRGRIALARAWALRMMEPGPVGEAHLDNCLGCRSCEAVCPAGVEYGELLVAARAQQRERRAPAWRQRVAEALSSRPRHLHRLLGLYGSLHRWLPAGLRPLPAPWAPLPMPPRAPAGSKDSVVLFVGCVAGPYESGVRAAVTRLCAALDVDAMVPPAQTCCGSLHRHAGNIAEADALAARNRRAFDRAGTVLTLASGCHESVLKALSGDSRVEDAISYFGTQADRLNFETCPERVALHLPCTQRHVVKSVPALRRLLAKVPGLQVIELDAGFGCCGAAGTQMLTQPQRAASYRQPLLDQFVASGATRLLSANIGCRLHLGNATTAPVQHPLEFLGGLLRMSPDTRAHSRDIPSFGTPPP